MDALPRGGDALDLDPGVTGADLPADVTAVVVQDVTAMWDRRKRSPDLTLVAADLGRRWGSGAVTAAGPLGELVGWVTGRTPGGA